ncbi:clathrin associated protein complex medium subunit [Blastocladiella emersonii ATCC 22665]|nr:clathrin associated protein complex medium subunit [Blastocladiella emersonii ATCC 22665]
MISGIFLFNYKGEVLISRTFRPDIKRSTADLFRIHVITAPQIRSPVTVVGNLSFFHVKHENIYVVAAARTNVNVAVAFEFCNKLIALGESYFGKFNEDAVKANFTLIYELLEEIMDFGVPQLSDADTLKMYITTESVRSEAVQPTDASKITIQATGATSWRRPDIKYRRNEVFIDVIEEVNLLVSNKSATLSADVAGTIKVKAFLSGTPECRFGLNERASLERDPNSSGGAAAAAGANTGGPKKLVEIDDFQFHQCVKLGRFDAERTISFIPPDGEFDLMRYRATEGLSMPFKVHPVVNYISQTRLEYKINLRSQFPRKFTASGLVIKIPTPPNTVAVNGLGNFANGHGKAKYVAGENCIVWKIPRMTGNVEMDLNAEAELSATFDKKAWSRPPISLDFTVAMFTVSGAHVRFLKVFEKSGYDTVKWVRYHSKAGNYQFRF